jgi:hypothetical protein
MQRPVITARRSADLVGRWPDPTDTLVMRLNNYVIWVSNNVIVNRSSLWSSWVSAFGGEDELLTQASRAHRSASTLVIHQ